MSQFLRLLPVLLGIALLLVTVHFAQRVEAVPENRSRESAVALAMVLRGELGDLQARYEGHLKVIHAALAGRDTFGAEATARRLEGVLAIAVLDLQSRGREHFQLVEGDESTAMPVLRLGDGSAISNGVPLGPEDLPSTGSSAWLPTPLTSGQVVFAENYGGGRCGLIIISLPTLKGIVNQHLQEPLAASWRQVEEAGGPDRVTSPDGELFATREDFIADLQIPAASAFGSWSVESADRTTERRWWHRTTLLIGIPASLLLPLGLSALQSATRRAQERVSFVNRASHELRTPLTNIRLNADLLEETVAEDPEASRRLDLVRDESARLGRLIDNVLSFSRRDHAEAGLRISPIDPIVALEDVLETFGPSLQRRGIAVDFTPNQSTPDVLAEPDALAQILGNLLSNVEKYAATGGALRIVCGESDGMVQIRLEDDGPGIPSGAARKIFRPFARLSERADEGSSGTGLGLAISRELAEAMDGQLDLLRDGRGQGATFLLSFPTAPASP